MLNFGTGMNWSRIYAWEWVVNSASGRRLQMLWHFGILGLFRRESFRSDRTISPDVCPMSFNFASCSIMLSLPEKITPSSKSHCCIKSRRCVKSSLVALVIIVDTINWLWVRTIDCGRYKLPFMAISNDSHSAISSRHYLKIHVYRAQLSTVSVFKYEE